MSYAAYEFRPSSRLIFWPFMTYGTLKMHDLHQSNNDVDGMDVISAHLLEISAIQSEFKGSIIISMIKLELRSSKREKKRTEVMVMVDSKAKIANAATSFEAVTRNQLRGIFSYNR